MHLSMTVLLALGHSQCLSVNILILLMMSHLQKSKLHLSCDISQECRSLALPVAAPVYHEYNYIDLRKHSRSRRIDRLVLSELPNLTQSKSESGRRDRWEQSLDRYMLAKEQLQSRRGESQGSKFDFLRLNKINQYRKQKLVEAHSLPLSMIRSTDLNQTYSFDLDPEVTSKARRVSTQKNTLRFSPKKELPQQERILNSILQSYFKKKYSLPQRLRPIKNQKISSVIIKKQNRKIKF